ncbi:MAG TPA: hypothetical protein PKG70_07775 [Chitinophagales bacterium]|nr:hypothetical protein [Chitinophagales bacterium]HNB47824.1 hypothetical protein [Chitinophagales bacterium]HNF51610.1 hypothetical protein [Chitinophagales bacterium]HNG72045.1 hypothetical protein [Chitinophagales bacterium]HNK11968.1 hypothetical protein [Chitinophagales bacterium]
MQKVEFIIKGANEKPISIDIRYIENKQRKRIIIFSHGFKGFKNWGHFDIIADYFAQNGFLFVKYNFSHNGTTAQQLCDFVNLEAFGQNNFSKEINDLSFVIDYIYNNANDFEGNNNEIYLIGHSRGGGISILKAANELRIKKLCTWASIQDISYFFQNMDIEKWKIENVAYTFNSRTQQNMPLYYQLYEDYLKNKNELDITKAATSLSIPWLIIHGTNDNSVSPVMANALHQINPKSEILLIEDADHTFGGKHPWHSENLPIASKILVEKTLLFFTEKYV